ncbi:MAG TPA: transketolase [Ktedonobacterales bacterium]|nr:transketolase [Ktedonobacterales bacterium]
MNDTTVHIRQLMALATGDEKHTPSALSTLDVLWVLYDRLLRYDPAQPRCEDRDRFVLSKGHGPAAYYAILADKGFFPIADLATFERYNSRLGGHPDRNQVPGVEASTGSLGHGMAMAVGMALALQIKGSDRRVFALVGDGECNEGEIWEAALVAGDRGLTNLTVIVVDNHSSTIALGDIAAKFTAFGWAAQTVDGHDQVQLYQALCTSDAAKPTLVVAVTE